MLHNVAIQVSFDGSCFHGWQFQKNAFSVEEALETGWFQLTGEKIRMIGSSRTDAGVHADSLVANFLTATSIPTEKIHLAINTKLPDGVAVRRAVDVPHDFQARFHAIGKFYSYYFFLAKVKPTYLRNYVAYITDDLDLTKMRQATTCFEGEQDFAALMDQGTPVHSTVRKITSVSLTSCGENLLRLDVVGNGFLYHMVRILAGTLFYVGNGKIDHNELPALLATGDRTKLGKTMPPNGLFLNKVYYENELFGADNLAAFLNAGKRQTEIPNRFFLKGDVSESIDR